MLGAFRFLLRLHMRPAHATLLALFRLQSRCRWWTTFPSRLLHHGGHGRLAAAAAAGRYLDQLVDFFKLGGKRWHLPCIRLVLCVGYPALRDSLLVDRQERSTHTHHHHPGSGDPVAARALPGPCRQRRPPRRRRWLQAYLPVRLIRVEACGPRGPDPWTGAPCSHQRAWVESECFSDAFTGGSSNGSPSEGAAHSVFFNPSYAWFCERGAPVQAKRALWPNTHALATLLFQTGKHICLQRRRERIPGAAASKIFLLATRCCRRLPVTFATSSSACVVCCLNASSFVVFKSSYVRAPGKQAQAQWCAASCSIGIDQERAPLRNRAFADGREVAPAPRREAAPPCPVEGCSGEAGDHGVVGMQIHVAIAAEGEHHLGPEPADALHHDSVVTCEQSPGAPGRHRGKPAPRPAPLFSTLSAAANSSRRRAC